ncbi:MAG: hypothetical protein HKN95_04285 [Acidimicrobiia bacterium]|nr:hypothetical protein [Acidimicrobiia bacterium]
MSISSTSRIWRLVAILAIFALIAAACGSDTTEETDAPAATTAPADEPADEPMDEPADEPADEPMDDPADEPSGDPFTYRLGMTSDLTTTNYLGYLCGGDSTVYNSYVLGPAHLGLFSVDLPSLAVVPSLAEGMPASPVEEGGSWTITQPLKQGVMWSDGVEFTSADVVFTWNAVRDGGLGADCIAPYPHTEESSPRLLSLEALDDYTVKYTFDARPGLGTWPHNVGASGFVLSENFWGPIVEEALGSEDPAAIIYGADGTGEPSIGSLKFDSWEEGAFVVNTANSDYSFSGQQTTVYDDGTIEIDGEQFYGSGGGNIVTSYNDGPYASQVTYSVYTDQSAAMLALINGEIDYWINPLGVSPGLRGQGLEAGNLSVAVNATNGMRYLAFNLRKSPGSYLEFRQAVAYMIDKEFLTQNVLQGVAFPMYVMVPEGNQKWFNNEFADEVKSTYQGLSSEERLAAAMDLLVAAGWTWDVDPFFDADLGEIIPGEGITDPAGVKVPEIEILAPPASYDPLRATASLWIEGWLEQLGVPARANPTDFNTIVAKIWPGVGEEITFDMYILGWSLGNPALPTFHEAFWHSRYFAEDNDGNNSTGFANAEFDAAADAVLAAETEEDAYDKIWEAEAILAEQLPYVVLFDTPITEFFSNELTFPFTQTLSGLQFGQGFAGLVQK